MRDIISLPRGQIEAAFIANDHQVMRLLFAGLPDDSVEEYIEIVGTPEGMRGCLDWYRALPQEPGGPGAESAEFPAVDLPTLFVWSDQDPAIGPEGPYVTERYVTGPYRFVVLEGIGHWIPEMAADRFSAELLSHLATHPAGS